jgi:hypothetical protein
MQCSIDKIMPVILFEHYLLNHIFPVYTLENSFTTDFICVSALKKSDMQQEQQFSRTPSPQSPVCSVGNTDHSTSHVSIRGDNSRHHPIQVFITHILVLTLDMHCKVHMQIEKKLEMCHTSECCNIASLN